MSYAGFWKRLIAFLIDAVITVMGGALADFILRGVMAAAGRHEPATADYLGRVLGIVFIWIYFAVMESSSGQGTLGKTAVGIKVTDLEGNRVTFWKANGRFFGKLLSALTLMIGFIMAAFTRRKRALHDIIAGCLVLNR